MPYLISVLVILYHDNINVETHVVKTSNLPSYSSPPANSGNSNTFSNN